MMAGSRPPSALDAQKTLLVDRPFQVEAAPARGPATECAPTRHPGLPGMRVQSYLCATEALWRGSS